MFVASPLDRLANGFAGEGHRSGDSANAGGLEREAHQQEPTDHGTDQRPIHRARDRINLGCQIAQRIVTDQQRVLDHGASGKAVS
jgi:hypothetical protein